MSKIRIVGIMPLKTNNERLPGKNTMLLGKKPLLNYQLMAAKKTNLIDDIYVFCSDEQIKKILPKGVHFLKREICLDLPTSNFNQIIESFIKKIDADIYVYIHATAPFVTIETIKKCVLAVKEDGYDSAFCAVKIQDFLWENGKPLNFDPTNLPRSQDLKPIYRETSGVYVFTKEEYLKNHRRIGTNPYIKVVSYKEAVDINEKVDFELAKSLLGINL